MWQPLIGYPMPYVITSLDHLDATCQSVVGPPRGTLPN
jgi:hypothetical protein